MLKQVLAFILIVAFSVQSLSRMMLVASYYANTSAYAKNCENKARPQLHCDGKCQLAIKLKKQAQKEEQSSDHKAEKKDEVVCHSDSFLPENTIEVFIISTKYPATQCADPIDRSYTIFHPPAT